MPVTALMMMDNVTGSRGGSLSTSRSSSPPLVGATSSNQPSVIEDQFKWTIYHSAVNLPAALNDPRLTKRETDFFSKTWGDSFHRNRILPSPYLPEITQSHFEKYLHKTGSVSVYLWQLFLADLDYSPAAGFRYGA